MPDSTNDTNKDDTSSTYSLASLVRNGGAGSATTPWLLPPRMSREGGFPAGAPLFLSSESPSPSPSLQGLTRTFVCRQSPTRTRSTTRRYCNDLSEMIDQALQILVISEEDVLWREQDEVEHDDHQFTGNDNKEQDQNFHQRRS